MAAVEIIRHDKVTELKLQTDGRNTLTADSFAEIAGTLAEIKNDNRTKVLVFTSGVKGFFSNGLDPELFIGLSKEQIRENSKLILENAASFFFFPVPTITVISGHCMGAGSVFALCSDYRYMTAKKGRIGFPEALIAMSFPAFGATLLKDLVGRDRARDILYSGTSLKGQQALDAGLVNAVYEPDELYEKSMKAAEKLAKTPRESLTAMKAAFTEPYRRLADEVYEKDLETMTETICSDNTQEGFISIKEGRRPVFSDF